MGKASRLKKLRKDLNYKKTPSEYEVIETPKTVYVKDYSSKDGIKAVTVIKQTLVNKTKKAYKEAKKSI
ncbi:MAG: hypothetical protein PHF86_10385 [Candidatus Nanoarchaeia archaeon]|jgi:hypothetical protein|nr:hypothetical protein [Candidatus Nanoarchaeia archaeon]